jgi:hypothetical protein
MSVTYIQHPAGYPTITRRIGRAGAEWAIYTDQWDTPTSHQGERRGERRFATEAEATAELQGIEACRS